MAYKKTRDTKNVFDEWREKFLLSLEIPGVQYQGKQLVEEVEHQLLNDINRPLHLVTISDIKAALVSANHFLLTQDDLRPAEKEYALEAIEKARRILGNEVGEVKNEPSLTKHDFDEMKAKSNPNKEVEIFGVQGMTKTRIPDNLKISDPIDFERPSGMRK